MAYVDWSKMSVPTSELVAGTRYLMISELTGKSNVKAHFAELLRVVSGYEFTTQIRPSLLNAGFGTAIVEVMHCSEGVLMLLVPFHDNDDNIITIQLDENNSGKVILTSH